MRNSVAARVSDAGSAHAAIRVMIVDDSVVVRNTIMQWLDEEPNINGVAAVRNGREAIEQIDLWKPDIVILDVEMPEIDGLSALPQLLQKRPGLVVIVASKYTRENAEHSMRALGLGAADYMLKPESRYDLSGAASFRRDLIQKIRALAPAARRSLAPPSAPRPAVAKPLAQRPKIEMVPSRPATPARLRPAIDQPRALVIGASTGGPQALGAVIKGIGAVIDVVPILIVQHMPATFTAYLAQHLERASGRPAREAQDDERLCAGTIYVAPGGRHMRLAKGGEEVTVRLDDSPPVNYCRPSVDVLFASAATVWGANVLGLVLTGMGIDGLRGCDRIVLAGGEVVVQNEETSVVWGMPGAIANAGLASHVLALDEVAPWLVRRFGRGQS